MAVQIFGKVSEMRSGSILVPKIDDEVNMLVKICNFRRVKKFENHVASRSGCQIACGYKSPYATDPLNNYNSSAKRFDARKWVN
jgi:hypothetical protein